MLLATASKLSSLYTGSNNGRRWESIGRYDPPHLTLAKARKVAGDRLAQIRLGLREDTPSLTFEEAFELFRQTDTSQKTARAQPRIRSG